MSQLWDIRQPVRTLAEDIIMIRYQDTSSKKQIKKNEVLWWMHKLASVLCSQLLIFTSCMYKWLINPVTYPNPVGNHTHTRDSIYSADKQIPKFLETYDLLHFLLQKLDTEPWPTWV
jgi:hypothetical protein